MNRENYKSKRKGQPKRNRANNRSKSSLVTAAKVWNTPKLREVYSNRTEWATKMLPKLKEK
jgi:hypothetical protein